MAPRVGDGAFPESRAAGSGTQGEREPQVQPERCGPTFRQAAHMATYRWLRTAAPARPRGTQGFPGRNCRLQREDTFFRSLYRASCKSREHFPGSGRRAWLRLRLLLCLAKNVSRSGASQGAKGEVSCPSFRPRPWPRPRPRPRGDTFPGRLLLLQPGP